MIAPAAPTSTVAVQERASLYLGRVSQQDRELHLSAIPFIPGIDALCGQSLSTASTSPRAWRQAVSMSTCPACRTRANKLVDVMRGIRT